MILRCSGLTLFSCDRESSMADGNITKDVSYEAVDPGDFVTPCSSSTATPSAPPAFGQDHQRHPRPLLGSARPEIHRLLHALRSRERPDGPRPSRDGPAHRLHVSGHALAIPRGADAVHQHHAAVELLLDLHGEQGRAQPLGLAGATSLYDQGAQRNTPPTRPARRPATSPPFCPLHPHRYAGAARRQSAARRSRRC